jgi:EAL domain-containing protein (putative c-di-GMP-specific phosphodiesterase class I)
MRPLTLAVLDQALRQQHLWRQAGLEIPMSVNLSATNLMDTRLPDDIASLLHRHNVPSHLLELEITEHTLMRDPERSLDVLARVSELGIDFALDDFGTGYSSLSLLAKLPVRQLKIDRSFVMQMSASSDNANIVRCTIEMAHSLNLTVVAEGVETAEQLAALRTFGADTAQGYHISRPIPAHELEIWLARSTPPDGLYTKELTAGAQRFAGPQPQPGELLAAPGDPGVGPQATDGRSDRQPPARAHAADRTGLRR